MIACTAQSNMKFERCSTRGRSSRPRNDFFNFRMGFPQAQFGSDSVNGPGGPWLDANHVKTQNLVLPSLATKSSLFNWSWKKKSFQNKYFWKTTCQENIDFKSYIWTPNSKTLTNEITKYWYDSIISYQ